MSDLPTVLATGSMCVAILSCLMSWSAIKHGEVVWRSHKKLHKDFWDHALNQADQNRRQWESQGWTLGYVNRLLLLLGATPIKTTKPPDPPN